MLNTKALFASDNEETRVSHPRALRSSRKTRDATQVT